MQVSLQKIFYYFLRLGCFGFGGPVALVGYMEKDLVDRNQWLTQKEFSQGVALAAMLPGPLAAQVAMWVGYLRRGFWGCTVASIGLIGPPFLMVLIISAIYVHFEKTFWIQALFYGIGPAVAALVAESCHRLGRRYLQDWKMILVALVCLVVTVIVHAELVLLFIMGGVVGVLIYGQPNWPRISPLLLSGITGTSLFQEAALGKAVQLCLFFFKAGLFTFGSGLAVAPFIHQRLVLENHWLTERQFLDTVAVGMITPGPVVIMATFSGYLIQGFSGAFIASLGVFMPIYLMVLFFAKLLIRHRENRNVTAFVKGTTAAAVGVISGAAIIVGRGVVIDWLTGLILVISLILIARWKISAPLIVAGAGMIGLLVYR